MKELVQLAWERFEDWCRERRIRHWGDISKEMVRTGAKEHALIVMALVKAESGLRSIVQINRMERKKRLKR
ncbi:hypothetical protein [Lysobacter enzymogenes]|uniref:hypothetical protein n=1 Tax=Lysobacter enzymogenes TaxID=69 RepID=UPI001AF5C0B4|nr:hypothetical protein [Lysobacter enzymogenes]QQQ01268.1 hypothetical protein JHW41_25055 [Lysobacter enzymogenes]